MASLVLTCGLAGAGKSTYARALEAKGWLRLSIDQAAWERGFHEHPLPVSIRDDIVAAQRVELVTALKQGRDVVVDYAFWSRAMRDEYREIGHAHGASVEVVYFDVPREELLRRLNARSDGPGDPDSINVSAAQLDIYAAGFQAPGPDETDVVAPDQSEGH